MRKKEEILDFLNNHTPDAAAYLVKMAHLGRTSKMTPEEFEICKIIKHDFSDIHDLGEGENPMFETLVDKCIFDTMFAVGLIKPKRKELSLKEKFKKLFKREKPYNPQEKGTHLQQRIKEILIEHNLPNTDTDVENINSQCSDGITDQDIEKTIFGN